jgi:hypothetical protein
VPGSECQEVSASMGERVYLDGAPGQRHEAGFTISCQAARQDASNSVAKHPCECSRAALRAWLPRRCMALPRCLRTRGYTMYPR